MCGKCRRLICLLAALAAGLLIALVFPGWLAAVLLAAAAGIAAALLLCR